MKGERGRLHCEGKREEEAFSVWEEGAVHVEEGMGMAGPLSTLLEMCGATRGPLP